MNLDKLNFRKATSQERDRIDELFGEDLRKLHKKSKGFVVFSWCVAAIMAIAFLCFMCTTDTSDPETVFSIIAFAIGGIVSIIMLVLAYKDFRDTRNNIIAIDRTISVASITINNIRFVMNYDLPWHSGFANAYSLDRELISENVLVPTDFAFMIEMTGIDCVVDALMFTNKKRDILFAVPLTGGEFQ